ncbi:hypothetical protein RND81_10G079300, partial [Saponaria officinalis]
NSSSDGVLGPYPSHVLEVCPICCPHSSSASGSIASTPVYSTFGVGDQTSEQLWYPDTAAASHMTPHEGAVLLRESKHDNVYPICLPLCVILALSSLTALMCGIEDSDIVSQVRLIFFGKIRPLLRPS